MKKILEMSIKENIVAAYEQIAESYNEKIEYKPHNAYYDRPNTLSLIPEFQDKSILDAACGPGKYAQIFISKGANVTGIDISNNMVELAKKRNKDKGHFFVHDLSQPILKCKNESFDIVLCAQALHYIEDWNLPIKEFNRVLKPNGILVISTGHPFSEYNHFKSSNYFATEHVSTIWKGFGKHVEMNSFRRPLSEYFEPLINNGFYIDKLVEQKPTKDFEKSDPKRFHALNKFPGFISIRAIKKLSLEVSVE